MKLLIVFSSVLALTVARPGYLAGGIAGIVQEPAVVTSSLIAAPVDVAPKQVIASAPAVVSSPVAVVADVAPNVIVASAPAVVPASSAVIADVGPRVIVASAPAVVPASAAVISDVASKAIVASAPVVVNNAPSVVVADVAPKAVVSAVSSLVVAPLTVTSQHHAQDELGQYAYGYAGGPSAKEEIHTADGITQGGYSYIDANGLVQSTSYVSDPVNGFRVAATNLPVAPKAEDAVALGAPQQVPEEPIVAATRAAHEQLKVELAAAAEASPDIPEPIAVEDAAPAVPSVVLSPAVVPLSSPVATAADVAAHLEAKKAILNL